MTLLYLALAYLAGVAVGQLLWQQGLFGCGVPGWLWTPPLLGIAIALWWDRRAPRRVEQPLRWPVSAGFTPPRTGLSQALVMALALAALTGLLRYVGYPLQLCWTPTDLAYHNAPASADFSAPPLTVTGFVDSYPVVKKGRQQFDVRVEALRRNGGEQPVTGRLRLKTGSRHRFRYGEPLRVTGLLVEPPVFDDFDYRAYLARKGIHSLMQRPRAEPLPGPNRGHPLYRLLYAVRARGEALLDRLLPEPYAALANGMLLGIEAGIPDELYAQFNRTGTSHVIVISGSNVAIVAAVLMAMGVHLLGRRRALWPTLAGIGFYAFLVGGDAAVLRAALMGGLFVVATVLRRQSTALVSLAAAGWAMTLANPLTLWDVGFQLSGAATAGLILFAPGLIAASDRLRTRMAEWGRRNRTGARPSLPRSELPIPQSLWGIVQDGLLMTIAASLTTLPLVVYYFGRLSVVSLFTNLLIAPVQPFIMLYGGAGVILGLIGLIPLAQVLLWIPYLSLLWTVAMVQWTAALPGASVEIAGYGGGALAATYGLIGVWHWRAAVRRWGAWRMEWAWLRSVPWLGNGALGGLAVAALLVWRLALSQPDGYLHVQFLDIGQGDGIFVQTPSGRQVLVDGGSDPQRLFAELGAVMPFWDRSLDLVIATHPDRDHFGAQPALPERYRIGRALISENVRQHEDSGPWRDAFAGAGVPVGGQRQGGWIDLGDGVALWVLWPPPEAKMPPVEDDDKNERSLVMRLVYGDFSVLLTGDAGLPSEAAMARAGLPLASQVLKVGHHGSRRSTGPAFVEAVGAPVAVIQVGENRYGHPHASVLETLAGRLVLRNDRAGRIHIRSDGHFMWIETERGDPLGK